MAEKCELNSSALAGGLTGLSVYILCGTLLYLIPGQTMMLFTSMIHSSIAFQVKQFELTSLGVGAIVAFAVGAFIAGAFVFFYNKLHK